MTIKKGKFPTMDEERMRLAESVCTSVPDYENERNLFSECKQKN